MATKIGQINTIWPKKESVYYIDASWQITLGLAKN
jgi:hypothetical protein